MEKTSDRFLRNLKEEMIRQDLDYAGLAKLAGLSRSGLYKIVEGHRWPSSDNLDRIAKGLNKSVSWLFRDPSSPQFTVTPRDALEVLSRFVDTQTAQYPDLARSIPEDIATQLAHASPDVIEAVRVVLMRAAKAGESAVARTHQKFREHPKDGKK